MTPTNLSTLQAQLAALGETMQQSLQRVEINIQDINQRLRGLETREAGCQPLINQRLDAAWRTIDEQKTEIATVKKTAEEERIALAERITKLESRLALVTGVGSLAGTAIILWLLNNWLGLIR
jgi:hypothetical protein